MEIVEDSLIRDEIVSLLREHLDEMHTVSPPESAHALDVEQLKDHTITFWSAWDNDILLGCAALKELAVSHGEVKSMRTTLEARGSGVGSKLLEHIINVAVSRGYTRLSLETGSMAHFEPARNLYLKHGFSYCDPFAGYKYDPNSVFMSKQV